jgi:hypothetical protein
MEAFERTMARWETIDADEPEAYGIGREPLTGSAGVVCRTPRRWSPKRAEDRRSRRRPAVGRLSGCAALDEEARS